MQLRSHHFIPLLVTIGACLRQEMPIVEPDVAALLEVAAANEVKARDQVRDTTIKIEGLVQAVELLAVPYDKNAVDFEGRRYTKHEVSRSQRVALSAPDGSWTTYCFFVDEQDNGVSKLSTGQSIHVHGTFVGFHESDDNLALVLSNCELD